MLSGEEALREEGTIVVRDGEAAALDASRALHVPETVQGVLRTRIDRLDTESRDVLRVAAVVGREFTRGVLDDVLGDGSDLATAMERLKGSGLVQQVGVVPEPSFRFKHALTQEVAYDSLLEPHRTTLHASVGRSIERRHAARLDDYAERLAHHFSRAEAWSEAVHYGLRAADRATGLSQNVDALHTLERVEGWAERLPDESTRRDLQADVLLRQERLSESMGLRHRQLAIVEALIGLLAPHGPSERLSQAYLRQGDAYTLLRRFEAAERSLETSMRIASERADSAGERNALRSLAFLRSHEGRREEALALIDQVLELGRTAGDARAEAGDMATKANILRAMGEHERALEVLQGALARTTQADNPVRYGALLNVIGTVYRELGDHENAFAYFRRTAGLLTHPLYASFSLPVIANLHVERGEIDEALATYRQALEMNRKARYADGTAQISRSLGEVLLGLGRAEEAIPHLREAAALFEQLEDRQNLALMRRRLATAHEERQQWDHASEAWGDLRELLRAHDGDPAQAEAAEAAEGVARARRQLTGPTGDVVRLHEEALALWQRLGERKRELALRNVLGILHWQRGAFAEAVRHYEAALRLCRELQDRVHEGLILSSLGATLHRLRRYDEARTALAEGVRVTGETGERQLRAHALGTLGEVCLASGRLEEARTSVEASLALRRELGDRQGEGWMLERLARVHASRGAPDEARAAADAALGIAHAIGDGALYDAASRLLAMGEDGRSSDSPAAGAT